MPRVQLDFPAETKFTCELTVRGSDLNYGNHVGNDSMLTLMQEARISFYRSVGYRNELNFEGTIGHVIADATIVYKLEAFLGDVLTVDIAVTDFHKYGFDMFYRLRNKLTGKDVAIGKTGMVFFDYEKRKVASIPAGFLEKVKVSL
ncbi:MAG TPA: thioesterase family protein [Cyclobacteriaceae bacterium]|nr:thioesterase family protein [Cyclobacteriaceae bacterium]HMV07283.1 thioesterase family protein [Cyclobacteriaceae bacterium]HMV89265.1 thioesterase family protein [Cyclobacteriaceae bacterium]HMW99362.1 thioesterase family protein [Cyclobacteriaceae bacterium]HMX48849.1 thioesterase family protein [Cyclobacteriaceae bacterium]